MILEQLLGNSIFTEAVNAAALATEEKDRECRFAVYLSPKGDFYFDDVELRSPDSTEISPEQVQIRVALSEESRRSAPPLESTGDSTIDDLRQRLLGTLGMIRAPSSHAQGLLRRDRSFTVYSIPPGFDPESCAEARFLLGVHTHPVSGDSFIGYPSWTDLCTEYNFFTSRSDPAKGLHPGSLSMIVGSRVGKPVLTFYQFDRTRSALPDGENPPGELFVPSFEGEYIEQIGSRDLQAEEVAGLLDFYGFLHAEVPFPVPKGYDLAGAISHFQC